MSKKEKILEMLEKNFGGSVSGEEIAAQVGVSRSAVWYLVKKLRSEGYNIAGINRKGYFLLPDTDILSEKGIRPFLNSQDGDIYVYNTLESTNITAKELAVSGAAHGTAVIADSQTAGRGRRERGFFSPGSSEGQSGIYMSFVLRPGLRQLDNPTDATYFAAVCVCRAIEEITGKPAKIKWVNDILMRRGNDWKKVCGISAEAGTDFETGAIDWLVVGIGINFTAKNDTFPEELRGIAGAIYEDGENPAVRNTSEGDTPTQKLLSALRLVTRNRLAASVINHMRTFSENCGSAEILDAYRSRLMMLGKKVTVTGLAEEFEATALDIDSSGHLLVRKSNGEVQELLAGEISVSHGQPPKTP